MGCSQREHYLYVQSGQIFAIILIDIDYFKKINDRYGHDGGDRSLKHMAQILKTQFRSPLGDFASRWGGEEFLVLLPNVTLQQAGQIAEQLRRDVEQNPTVSGITMTISLGVATIGHHGYSIESLITAADHALYAAKQSGRNQVKVALSPEFSPHQPPNP